MNKFKAGDKVKVVSAERDTYWYASKIGNIYTLKSFDGEDWSVKEDDFGVFAPCDLELYQSKQESTSAWLKENKWFIRTGSPEKSKLVQEWLFEHGYKWCTVPTKVQFTDKAYLTNTYNDSTGEISEYIKWGDYHHHAQEITLEFETVLKSVKFPEVAPKKTEQELCIEKLEATIAQASAQIKQLKEGV